MVKHPRGQAALDACFGALADATRRAMLQRLEGQAMTVGELARPFAISPPAVTKHLDVLERAGLVERRRRGRERVVRLRPGTMREAGAWMARHRRFWEEQLDALDAHLASEKE